MSREKTVFLSMRKQRCRSAMQLLIIAFFCGCVGRFVSNLVGNPKDQRPVVQNFVTLTPSLRPQLVK